MPINHAMQPGHPQHPMNSSNQSQPAPNAQPITNNPIPQQVRQQNDERAKLQQQYNHLSMQHQQLQQNLSDRN